MEYLPLNIPRIRSDWKIFFVSLTSFALVLVTFTTLQAQEPSTSYTVEQVVVGETMEYRFKLNHRHFGSLIDQGGTFAFRPHPGCDVNGWGSTWYAQPFLPGATLKHTIFNRIEAVATGIRVNARGNVSRNVAETYGEWSIGLHFTYDALRQIVSATGQYTITLPAPLNHATGDLNLYKIASNYLDDVPLLSGGIGDTGDMKHAIVMREPDVVWFIWLPPNQPAHYPTDTSRFLSIDAVGQFNNVDTARQGYAPIAPAFKPSLKVILTSSRSEIMFGGAYDLSKSQLFWADNVGITPLISRVSPETVFHFDVTLDSVALETCVYLPLVMRR